MDKPQVTPLGWKGYFERYTAPILARDRFFLALLVSLALNGVMGFALASLVPLHSRVPYVVQIDSQGRVQASGLLARTIGKPTTAQLTYWLGRWVSYLYVVDPAYSQPNLSRAYAFTQGPAVGQMQRYITSDASPLSRLKANPALRTAVSVHSVHSIGPDEVYVVVLVKNLLTGKSQQHGVTLGYSLSPPSDVASAMNNPIGLVVNSFSMNGRG